MSRVYRLCGIQTGGGDLVLSALQLRSGSDTLEPVSITASHSPASGVLSDLLSAVDLETACTWPKDVGTSAGFYIELAFEADVTPDAVVLGSGSDRSEFVERFLLLQLAAGLWQVVQTADRVAWIAPQTLHAVGGGDSLFASVALLLPLDTDVAHKGLVPLSTQLIGGNFVADARALRGAVLDIGGTGGVRVDGLTNFAFLHDGATYFTIDVEFLYVPASGGQVLVATSVTSGNAGFFLGVLPSGMIYVTRYNGDSSTVYRQDIPGVLSTTAYTKLRFVYLDANTIRVDVNGVTAYSGTWRLESGSGAWAAGPQVNPLCVGVGRTSAGAYLAYFNGRIGDVRITKAPRALETKRAPWPASASTGLELPALSVSGLRQQRWLAAPPLTSKSLVVIQSPARIDREFGGQGSIYGTVELYVQAGNIPLPRRVRLHRSRDGLLARETWSDAQGNYRFEGISQRYTYDVIAWDHEGLQRSVVANDLTPEVMP